MIGMVNMLLGMKLTGTLSDLMDKSGKDTFTKNEVLEMMAKASMDSSMDLEKLKEENDKNKDEDPEKLINKGLDLLKGNNPE